MKAIEVYTGSDGAVTRRFYDELTEHGAIGVIAVNLFRAQKCSTRAKAYRGGIRGKGSYKSMAYDTKNWALQNLVRELESHAAALGIEWGWKLDTQVVFGQEPSWVLYVELPEFGQVSFHSPNRGIGPDFAGEWDQQHKSAERVIAFCDSVDCSNLPSTAAALGDAATKPTASSSTKEEGPQ